MASSVSLVSRFLMLLFVLGAVVVSSSSCLTCVAQRDRAAMLLSGEVKLPDGWPIAELVPPPGSERAKISDGSRTGDESTETFVWDESSQTYTVGFHVDLSYTEVIAHLDSILEKLGYSVIEDKPGRLRRYESTVKNTQVLALYTEFSRVWRLQVDTYGP